MFTENNAPRRTAIADVSPSAAGHTLKLKTDRAPAIEAGSAVFVGFTPEAAHLFDPQDGLRL